MMAQKKRFTVGAEVRTVLQFVSALLVLHDATLMRAMTQTECMGQLVLYQARQFIAFSPIIREHDHFLTDAQSQTANAIMSTVAEVVYPDIL